MRYGYFSRRSAELHGTVIYLTPDGEEVEVTAIGSHPNVRKGGYKWADACCLGVVTNYVRKGRKGSCKMEKCRQ